MSTLLAASLFAGCLGDNAGLAQSDEELPNRWFVREVLPMGAALAAASRAIIPHNDPACDVWEFTVPPGTDRFIVQVSEAIVDGTTVGIFNDDVVAPDGTAHRLPTNSNSYPFDPVPGTWMIRTERILSIGHVHEITVTLGGQGPEPDLGFETDGC